MEILSLDEIRANCRVDNDLEDGLLCDLGNLAEEMVQRAIRRDWEEVRVDYGCVPRALKHACLMLCEHYYNNRGATSVANVGITPYGVEVLVKPYVKLQ